MSYQTQTQTAASTMTAARVRNVMVEVRADFTNVALAGLAELGPWMETCEQLAYILENGAAKSFQIMFTCPGQKPRALAYTVSADGSLRASDQAGGIDYYSLPAGTKAVLVVTPDLGSKNWPGVKTYLSQRGWGSGEGVSGAGSADRVYSSDGYGVSRSKIGEWT